MTLNEDYAQSLLNELEVDDFGSEFGKKLFTAAKEIHSAGNTIDVVSLDIQLGCKYLNQLTEAMLDVAYVGGQVEWCIETLRSFRKRREVIAACKLGIEEAKVNAEGYLDRLQTSVSAAADRAAKVINRVGNAATDALLNIGKKETLLSTGFGDIDMALGGGLRKTDMMVIGARPSVGKTAFAMNIAINAAMNGNVVAVYSMEMEQQSLLKRAAFSISRTSERDILRGNSQATMRALEAADKISGLRLYIDDRGGLTTDQIRTSAITIKNREKQLDLIVVDYLQLMACAGRKNGTREQEVADMSKAMKRLAMEQKCPVILLSQLSRGVENRDDKTPRLADLRESGSIEQDADSVLFLHRPAVWDCHADPHEAKVFLAKNRNGAIATIDLQWFGEWFLYTIPEREPDELEEYEEVPFDL